MKVKMLTLSAMLLLGTYSVTFRPSQTESVPTSVETADTKSYDYSAGWISVKTYGTGPDIILIPGLASSASVWDGTVKRFKETHRIHVVQMSGFANMPAGKIERTKIIDGLAQDIATYIDVKGLDKPIVTGHSMGGFTALHIARDFPESISQAVCGGLFTIFFRYL